MDSLLAGAEGERLTADWGREAVKEELRLAMAGGETAPQALAALAESALERRFAPTLCRVVNGTGVLLHTNLGRAPLSGPARSALDGVLPGYSSVEFDAGTGGRGKRQDHVRAAARDLFGAEDAIAVNNNAAGVFLSLAALARGHPVLVSRGELVAIGGSFKIPEILEASGARLLEVGTTNRTTPDDYRRALRDKPALLLTVHPSNYEIRGFTERPDPRELKSLAREAGIPWLHDQGTGCVEPLDEFGVSGEPTVTSCLADGADLVTFSGDKLFGGPQAGFVAGARRSCRQARGASRRARRSARQDDARGSRGHAACLEAGALARVSDLPRGGREPRLARIARRGDPGTALAPLSLDRSRALPGSLRRRDEPREDVSLARARRHRGGSRRPTSWRRAGARCPCRSSGASARAAPRSICARSSKVKTAISPKPGCLLVRNRRAIIRECVADASHSSSLLCRPFSFS